MALKKYTRLPLHEKAIGLDTNKLNPYFTNFFDIQSILIIFTYLLISLAYVREKNREACENIHRIEKHANIILEQNVLKFGVGR